MIPNSVRTIGDNAFHGCKSLTTIVIPNSVNTIGYSALRLDPKESSIITPTCTVNVSALSVQARDRIELSIGSSSIVMWLADLARRNVSDNYEPTQEENNWIQRMA